MMAHRKGGQVYFLSILSFAFKILCAMDVPWLSYTAISMIMSKK